MHRFICRGARGHIEGINDHLAALLIARGADTPEKAHRFLHPSESELNDPMRLHGMDKALPLIRDVLSRRAPVIVYGDYDCDGVCATAILSETFRRLNAPVRTYIPNRKTEGYGLNEEAVKTLASPGALLITVDCGITSVSEVRLAKELGMNVIVTDHHTPQEELPPADAIVHAALGDYPCKSLCGAGTAWKMACALENRIVYESLDLCALATIADMVPLLDENRVLAALGLREMQSAHHIGLHALLKIADIEPGSSISGMQAAFQLAPRINACGRMETADIALELLLTQNASRADQLADAADKLNARRKNIEQHIFEAADEQAKAMDLCSLRAIVVEGEAWESGVVGLAAGRLAERYGYPSVALSRDGDVCVGSARSASGVDLYQALYECRDLFVRFGGHKQAAGLTIEAGNLPAFRQRLSEAVASQLGDRIPMPETVYDSEIELSEITVPFIESLSLLEPFGMGNPAPVYLLQNADVLSARAVGADGNHLKLLLSQAGVQRDAIAFHMGQRAGIMHGECQLAITPVVNSFRGKVSAQCRVEAVGRSQNRFSGDPEGESQALLQELSTLCRINLSYPPADIHPFEEGAWQEEEQGTLLLCRTAETANRMCALYPGYDAVKTGAAEPRAYNAVWLCDKAACRGPYKRVVLCDGLLCTQEAAYVASLYPGCEIFAAPLSDALRARYDALDCTVDFLRDFYRRLMSGVSPDLSVPQNAAAARILENMGLIALAPAPQLLPMKKTSPENDPLYKLIRREGSVT
ncbi:MAG: single-stranded-DNA-specific exonuclease RecJ [Clostridia bacterium]|nr:single-stranded-DNA-specific exonuclease RecJ [Clostridia bacterium]